jgi:hypothetical protein
MNYENLKNKIASILLDHPADLFDDDRGLLFQTDTWELVDDRELPEYTDDTDDEEYEELLEEWDAKAVGSANLIVANTLLKKVLSQNAEIIKELQRVSSNNMIYEAKESTDELFELIMSDLESERIIRKKPEFVRQSFKVVGGTDV